MNPLSFSITINATPEKVWNVLWSDATYHLWTEVFKEGSYAKSDWKEGSRIHFLSPEGKGMYSRIKTLVPNQRMVFEHIGELKDFIEQPVDGAAKKWSGSLERYELKEMGSNTELTVTVDMDDEFASYFTDKFPKALDAVKELAMRPDTITVGCTVNVPVAKAWDCWTLPEHICNWCQASEDWHAPYAENDVRNGGRFKTVMAARDGSVQFDFSGTYTDVRPYEFLSYELDDNRKVNVWFEASGSATVIREDFEPEFENSIELQQGGWQAIMDSFKKYTESL